MRLKYYKRSAVIFVSRIIPYKQGQHARGFGKYFNRIDYLIHLSDTCQRKNKINDFSCDFYLLLKDNAFRVGSRDLQSLGSCRRGLHYVRII
jgi:hypothetical protein